MTPNEIVDEALGVVTSYTSDYPTTRAIMYRRVSARQRELFLMAAKWDPDYTGATAEAALDASGGVDLARMEEFDVYRAEAITEVRILDPGASTYTAGDKVKIVRVSDTEAHFPPRATLRDRALRQVEDDLDGVISLTVHYARLPDSLGNDGSGVIELEEPFQDLLVWDLARDLLRRTISIGPEQKTAALQVVTETENALLEGFQAHVRGFAPHIDRFQLEG